MSFQGYRFARSEIFGIGISVKAAEAVTLGSTEKGHPSVPTAAKLACVKLRSARSRFHAGLVVALWWAAEDAMREDARQG
jgi:hypothetical protein